ncbi:MAG: hypothetical protein ACTHOM_08140 [Allomuricauda sp.]
MQLALGYFLELLLEISKDNLTEMKSLHTEVSEILAIVVSSIKTAKGNGK